MLKNNLPIWSHCHTHTHPYPKPAQKIPPFKNRSLLLLCRQIFPQNVKMKIGIPYKHPSLWWWWYLLVHKDSCINVPAPSPPLLSTLGKMYIQMPSNLRCTTPHTTTSHPSVTATTFRYTTQHHISLSTTTPNFYKQQLQQHHIKTHNASSISSHRRH